jgi:hypothetical protein
LFAVTFGQRIAYVTDAADTAENRKAIIDRARDADVLFIEAAFSQSDTALAAERAHLPTAAGSIAREACVCRVKPFHFSARCAAGRRRCWRRSWRRWPPICPGRGIMTIQRLLPLSLFEYRWLGFLVRPFALDRNIRQRRNGALDVGRLGHDFRRLIDVFAIGVRPLGRPA